MIQNKVASAIKKEKKEVMLCFLFFFSLLAYAPAIAFFLSIVGLLCIGHFSTNNLKSYFVILSFITFLSTIVAAVSHPVFLFAESDFTTYYYNYQMFLDSGFDSKFFFFGGGLEVGVPLLNYLLSLIIDAPMPYMVKLGYALFQTSLLCFCIVKISKYHNLDLRQVAILLALTFLFFKYGSTLNHLRQGFSSLFIILALFSRKSRWLFILLALLFHLSAIVIYPLVKFLLTSKNSKLLRRYAVVFILMGILMFIALGPVSDAITNSNYKLLGKLFWAFSKAMETDNIITSVKGTLFASIYFIPLLLVGLYANLFYNKSVKFSSNIIAVSCFLIGFSFLPGLSVRVLSLILLIMMGYLYFVYFHVELKLKQSFLIAILFLFFFTTNWILFSPLYFYSYPMISSTPFYYVSVFVKEKRAMRRYTLPSQDSIIIQNPYKL